ncbi:hypothetical protein COU15_02575 [Candidatus Kaiserbacteria bacterium CG10_big_fil_rev_8_21_14_0_10_45_20]|uniref:Disulfide bond formation protein B n=1 Tax=Candidatus Kaiserbacteria bacterium CG10_big_fil_rev_8_21_14_0_10_45_20 TaxID=1974607 RepID=A0A2H0UH34_9BACT|nr:MAG: hypothetical protein COU15_02575 [Candidatus Kaiserbacteria bacterium CG10_big_fil_rev_8_21_14_0_10_45_20]
MITIENLNVLVGVGTIVVQVLTVFLIALFFVKEQDIHRLIRKIALPASLVLVFAGTALTLVYSEYLGVTPCGLCWLQRVGLYPQVILFAIALFVKDKSVALYSIGLSLFGAIVALYQHYLQMGGISSLPCPASGASDCAQRFLFEFGYITFPLSAFSLFALLIVLMLHYRKKDRQAV